MSRFLCENCRTYLDAPQKICPNCGNTLPDSPPLYAHILFQATILAILATRSCTIIPFVEQNPNAPYTLLGGFPCLLVLFIILVSIVIKVYIRRKSSTKQSERSDGFVSNYPRTKPRYIPPFSPSAQRDLFTFLALIGAASVLFSSMHTAATSKLIGILLGVSTVIASIYGYYWRYKE